MNILIVEDDPATLSLVSEFVKTMHMNPIIAKDGKEGLEAFKKFSPPIVITDIRMPKMGGLELVSAIKAESPETYITVTTAYDNPDYTIEAIKRGASSFLTKPFRVLDLYSIIQKQSYLVSESSTKIYIRHFIEQEIIKLKIKNTYIHMQSALDFLSKKCQDYLDLEELAKVRKALLEMLINAIEHGNLELSYEEKIVAMENNELQNLMSNLFETEPYASRMVEIEFIYQPSLLRWIISDQGKGFDFEEYLAPLRQSKFPLAPGKGIITSFFQVDSLKYEDNGRRVIIEKSIK